MKLPEIQTSVSLSSPSSRRTSRFYKKKFIKSRSEETSNRRCYHTRSMRFIRNKQNVMWNGGQTRKQTLFWLKYLIQLYNFSKTTYWICLDILVRLDIQGQSETCKKTAISILRLSVKYNQMKKQQQCIKILNLLRVLQCRVSVQQLLQTQHSIYRGLQFKLPICQIDSHQEITRECLNIQYHILQMNFE